MAPGQGLGLGEDPRRALSRVWAGQWGGRGARPQLAGLAGRRGSSLVLFALDELVFEFIGPDFEAVLDVPAVIDGVSSAGSSLPSR